LQKSLATSLIFIFILPFIKKMFQIKYKSRAKAQLKGF